MFSSRRAGISRGLPRTLPGIVDWWQRQCIIQESESARKDENYGGLRESSREDSRMASASHGGSIRFRAKTDVSTKPGLR